MDILTYHRTGIEQYKKLKTFLQELDPLDYDIKYMIHTLDTKINAAEQKLSKLQSKSNAHRCGLCDRDYDEEEARAVENLKVCPTCRKLGSQFRFSGDLEKTYELPEGTIKRDCQPRANGKPPVLQPYIDCGLVNRSGIHYSVHEIVIQMYYMDEKKYRKRKRKYSD